jgi:hypothetical protein
LRNVAAAASLFMSGRASSSAALASRNVPTITPGTTTTMAASNAQSGGWIASSSLSAPAISRNVSGRITT